MLTSQTFVLQHILTEYFTIDLTYFVFNKRTWQQTFRSIKKLVPSHITQDPSLLMAVSGQQRPIITKWYSLKCKPPPRWLTTSLAYNILLHALGQNIVRRGFTWTVGRIQFLVPYSLQIETKDNIPNKS